MSKIIKDSVHGYIEVDDIFIPIVNSPEFQRLKYIEQGSFRVLYPSARHDRFIHSLGVYHLARLFSKSFIEHIQEDIPKIVILDDNYKKYEMTFHYAALLHDIGHAPFSHTTEHFFNQAKCNGEKKIEFDLKNAVKEYINKLDISDDDKNIKIENFNDDFSSLDSKPKPHEIISATILIKISDLLLEDKKGMFDLELAARMIIGCTYNYEKHKEENLDDLGIRNCFIRLLNSETMDVDKLDYITRDTFMTGFQNVSVDIARMAKSVSAIKKDGKYIYPAFRKNSISVIDNIFRAKKEHSNWILSHPVVLYESKLLKRAIVGDLRESNFIEKMFSIESLGRDKSETGFLLFNDNDIIHILKKHVDFSNDNIYNEIFDRSRRRKALWKSYHEYKIIFGTEGKKVFQLLKPLIDVLRDKYFVLDKDTYKEITASNEYDDNVKKIADIFNDFSNKNNIQFNFVLIDATTQFDLKFSAEDIYFIFPKNSEKGYISYSELINKGNDNTQVEEDYFYLFSRDKIDETKLSMLKKQILGPKRA